MRVLWVGKRLVAQQREQISERRRRELTAFADGRLRGWRRRRLEAALARSPELRRALEQQRRASSALAAVDKQAPPSLHRRLEGLEMRAPTVPPRSTLRRWSPAALPGIAGAVVAAVLFASGGAGDGSAIPQAAELGERPGERAAPVAAPGETLLEVGHAGVRFPDWVEPFGWRAIEVREDELDGRTALTVAYERGGRRIAYAILSGGPIEPPAGAVRHTVEGTELASLNADGRTVVTWLRQGRTCVLSATGVELSTLLELAAWRGRGSVPF